MSHASKDCPTTNRASQWSEKRERKTLIAAAILQRFKTEKGLHANARRHTYSPLPQKGPPQPMRGNTLLSDKIFAALRERNLFSMLLSCAISAKRGGSVSLTILCLFCSVLFSFLERFCMSATRRARHQPQSAVHNPSECIKSTDRRVHPLPTS